MAELLIDVSSCTSALQFLDTVGKSIGTLMGTFSTLNHYLLANYHPKLTFVHMKEFQERCPYAMKEMETILRRVKWHYQQEGKDFEFSLQA